jgi:hypothetical protein
MTPLEKAKLAMETAQQKLNDAEAEWREAHPNGTLLELNRYLKAEFEFLQQNLLDKNSIYSKLIDTKEEESDIDALRIIGKAVVGKHYYILLYFTSI